MTRSRPATSTPRSMTPCGWCGKSDPNPRSTPRRAAPRRVSRNQPVTRALPHQPNVLRPRVASAALLQRRKTLKTQSCGFGRSGRAGIAARSRGLVMAASVLMLCGAAIRPKPCHARADISAPRMPKPIPSILATLVSLAASRSWIAGKMPQRNPTIGVSAALRATCPNSWRNPSPCLESIRGLSKAKSIPPALPHHVKRRQHRSAQAGWHQWRRRPTLKRFRPPPIPIG